MANKKRKSAILKAKVEPQFKTQVETVARKRRMTTGQFLREACYHFMDKKAV